MTLKLRPLLNRDEAIVEAWLNKEHVFKWYDIPHLGVTIDDWMSEIRARNDEFNWLTHFIATWDDQPIGMCQYYRCIDSDEDFGVLPVEGTYGIDYLIGEEAFLGKGLGKMMIDLLVDKIFTLTDARRVTADIDRNNVASEKALLSCGFSLIDSENIRYLLERAGLKR